MKEEQRRNAATHISEENSAFSKLFEASKNQKRLEKIYSDLQKEYNKPVQSSIKSDNIEIKKKELDLVGNDFSQRKENWDKEVLGGEEKGGRRGLGGKTFENIRLSGSQEFNNNIGIRSAGKTVERFGCNFLENKRLSDSQEFNMNQNINIGLRSVGKTFENKRYSITQEYHNANDNERNDDQRFFSENKKNIKVNQSNTKLNSVQKSGSEMIKENAIILNSNTKFSRETIKVEDNDVSKKGFGSFPIEPKINEVLLRSNKKTDMKIEEVAEENEMSMKEMKQEENQIKVEQNEGKLKRGYHQMITNKESTSFFLGKATIKGFTLRAGNFSHIRKGKGLFYFYF